MELERQRDRIRFIREWKGLTQEKMANLLGISSRTYQTLERSDRHISGKILRKYAELGINLRWILEGKGEMLLKKSDDGPYNKGIAKSMPDEGQGGVKDEEAPYNVGFIESSIASSLEQLSEIPATDRVVAGLVINYLVRLFKLESRVAELEKKVKELEGGSGGK